MFAVVTHYLIIVFDLTEGKAYGAANEPQADYGDTWFGHNFLLNYLSDARSLE
jgi:hypothetical protein